MAKDDYVNLEMFRVKKDHDGEHFVRCLRSALNRKRYSLRVRGRKHDPELTAKYYGNKHRWSNGSVPHKVATQFAIYITDELEGKDAYVPTCECVGACSCNADLVREHSETNKELIVVERNLRMQNSNQRGTIQELRREVSQANKVVAKLREELKNVRADCQFAYKDRNDKANQITTMREQMVQHTITQGKGFKSNDAILTQIELTCNELLKDVRNISDQDAQERILRDRIRTLERFVQRVECESAGLSSLLQNDMNDLDIPIDDSK